MSARGEMGMGEMVKRLVNRVSNMASVVMADVGEDIANREDFLRPFHKAFLEKKVVCPKSQCIQNVLFFERNGLAQHFRMVHKIKHVTEQDLSESSSTMKRMYGEETLKYISYLSEKNSKTLANAGSWFEVSSEGKVISIFGQNPKEVSKMYGMFLLHSGKLKSYADQNNPCQISVRWPLGEARFKAWYTQGTMERNIQGTVIVVECYFVKKPLHHLPVEQQQTAPSTVTESVPVSIPDETTPKLAVLQTIFKHDNFKGKQEEAIDAILSGQDCLIILPTGAGKTLCYSIPAIISGGVTLVICPLLSLMLDQVQNLRSRGLNVTYINSSITKSDRDAIMHNMASDVPPYNFVFVTPETAISDDMKSLFSTMKAKDTLKYIVVDESHCVDLWGSGFRPAYAELGVLSSLSCTVVALTATCTSRTEKVIISSLGLTNPTIVRQTCNRENISLFVKRKKCNGKEQVVDEIVSNHKHKCGIVYCLQRAETTDMAYLLQTKGINATYYHGALDPYKKNENFQAWLDGKALVMCATVAFGMGIDKPDVRFVIHLSLPPSLECYAQEFGRAGRDGEESVSIVFFRFEDRSRQLKMISELPDADHRSLKLKNLNEIVKFCIQPKCRKLQLVHYFGDSYEHLCGSMCDLCLEKTNVEPQIGNDQALEVLSCLKNMCILQNKVTSSLLMLVYRGSKRKEVVTKSLHVVPEFGKGKGVFSEHELKQFIQVLIVEDVIVEELRGQKESGLHPYLRCGDKEELISQGELVIPRYKMK